MARISDSEKLGEAREQLLGKVGRLKQAFFNHSEEDAVEYVQNEAGVENLENAVTGLLDKKVLEVKYSGEPTEEDLKREAKNIYRQSKQYPYSDVQE